MSALAAIRNRRSAIGLQVSASHYRKGASAILAVLLIVAIVISSSMLTYVWTLGVMGNMMGGGGSQLNEQLILESYDWTSATPKVVVRNVGVKTSTISTAYLSGQVAAGLDGLVLEPGKSSGSVELTFTGSPGASYVLKIVTTTGAVFTSVMIAGSSG